MYCVSDFRLNALSGRYGRLRGAGLNHLTRPLSA